MAQVLGRVVVERFLSEPFLRNLSSSQFPGKIRSETLETTVFGEKRLEERLVKNALPHATTHSVDSPTKLGSSV